MATVYEWLNDSGRSAPATNSSATASPPSPPHCRGGSPAIETREGVYETARTAAQCLRDPQIMAWITPPQSDDDCPLFDPDHLRRRQRHLYLLSKEGGAAPRRWWRRSWTG